MINFFKNSIYMIFLCYRVRCFVFDLLVIFILYEICLVFVFFYVGEYR